MRLRRIVFMREGAWVETARRIANTQRIRRTRSGNSSRVGLRRVVFPTLSREEPVRVCSGELDEPEHHLAGDGRTGLITDPRAKRDAKGLGEGGAAVGAEVLVADFANSCSDSCLKCFPVGLLLRTIHLRSTAGPRMLL